MNAIDTNNLKCRTIPHVAEMLEQPLFRTRGPKQRENCWKIDDNMAMLDTALRGFHCGPIYIIKDIEQNIDDVFDGAHRCEALFFFMDDKYLITKGKKDTINWETSPLKNFVGKKFSELPKSIQQIIKNYKFYINVIEDETANDPAALGMLWERLSKAGAKLNNYETKTQTHSLLYKKVLSPQVSNWKQTPFFQQETSKRGQLESKLMNLLALSEKEDFPVFSSQNDLVEKWLDEVLGKTTEDIDNNTNDKAESLINRLKVLKNLMKELQDKKILHDEKGNCLIDKSREVPFMLILGRLGYWFQSISQFKRVLDEVSTKMDELLKKDPNDLCKYLQVNSRNAGYQKKLILEIDSRLKPLAQKSSERRCFTQQEKKKKLEEQGNICPECNTQIFEYQRNAGDHIVEFCRGGSTTYENLQILHKACHEKKNMV